MEHLYQDAAGTIHICQSGFAGAGTASPFLVWTACGKDVPANRSFKSEEAPNCEHCKAAQRGREGV